jgi:hypothetical protein
MVWHNILHDRINLIINDDQSIELSTELHLACTDWLALKYRIVLNDWLHALLTGG